MTKINVPLKLIAIEKDGFHLIVKSIINGKSARLLLDTGASRTVFDINNKIKFMKKQEMIKNNSLSTGLGTDKMISHTSFIKKFSIDKLVIFDYEGVFIDLSIVNSSYEKLNLKPIDGVLGSDLLKQFNAIINFEKQTLTFKV
jgi:hypothetical protein